MNSTTNMTVFHPPDVLFFFFSFKWLNTKKLMPKPQGCYVLILHLLEPINHQIFSSSVHVQGRLMVMQCQ